MKHLVIIISVLISACGSKSSDSPSTPAYSCNTSSKTYDILRSNSFIVTDQGKITACNDGTYQVDLISPPTSYSTKEAPIIDYQCDFLICTKRYAIGD